MILGALAYLSFAAFAQAPAASTGTVQGSSATVQGSTVAVPAPAPEPAHAPAPPPKPVNPIQVRIHAEAGDWEPVSLTAFAAPDKASNHFSRRLKKRLEKPKAQAKAQASGVETSASAESDKAVVVYRGESSPATALARVYPQGEDQLLLVSVHPKALARLRKHLEIRFKIVEGYLEEMRVAAITVAPGARLELSKEDSESLSAKGVSFSEEFPASGKAWVAAISTRPGALMAGSVERADFADKELKLTSFGWSAKLRR